MRDAMGCLALNVSIPDYQYREWSRDLWKYGVVRCDLTGWAVKGLTGRVLGMREIEQPPDQPYDWVRVELLCEVDTQS